MKKPQLKGGPLYCTEKPCMDMCIFVTLIQYQYRGWAVDSKCFPWLQTGRPSLEKIIFWIVGEIWMWEMQGMVWQLWWVLALASHGSLHLLRRVIFKHSAVGHRFFIFKGGFPFLFSDGNSISIAEAFVKKFIGSSPFVCSNSSTWVCALGCDGCVADYVYIITLRLESNPKMFCFQMYHRKQ